MASPLLVEIGVALTGIAVAGALAYRVGLSVIPAYILVGILIGPNVPTAVGGIPLALVQNREFISVLAELGIVFLLFFLGLEFSVGQLLGDAERIATAGSIDFAVNFGLGALLGVVFGLPLVETLFVAGVVYISSSAVVTKSLIENGWVANPEGGVILGTLVFEDLLIAIYLAVLAAVAFGSGSVVDAATSVATAFAFLGALALVAWYGSDVVDRAFDVRSDELFLLRVLGVTTLVAGAALTAGLSEAVAAFFVGTAFSGTDHTERIERVVAPARDFFAAVFFFSIGLTTDVTVFADVATLLGAAVVVTTLGKLVSGTLSGRVYGFDRVRSLRVGIGLVPRGEFSLVIAALAAGSGSGALATLVPAFAVGYVLVMSIFGTVLIQQADAVTAALSRTGDAG
jgi:CPA2 family monovalent cation:H+ antiporter-2